MGNEYMNSINPKISIITISYNAAATIEQTILSAIEQVYDNTEYIIIDGGSTDGTVDIINKYEDRIAYWVSEPDKGIYDAMNKGIDIATGEYLFFLNAGDYFAQKYVLKNIFSIVDVDFEKIIMGNVLIINQNTNVGIVKPEKKISPWYTPPHQGIFFPKKIYKTFSYYTGMNIISDREYYLRLHKFKLFNITLVDEVISKYNLEGVSSNPRNSLKILKEAMALYFIYGNSTIGECIYQIIKNLFKYLVSFLFSENIYNSFLYKIKFVLKGEKND